ncbi:MAG: hypothetical protein KTR24_05350, partial [Saprospiraceae bacterium]|nr:hypothetical protein [Saprospiraceae bacterium]
LNRSYLLHNLSQHKTLREKMALFQKLRSTFIHHVERLTEPEKQAGRVRQELENLRKKGVVEGLWTQLLFLLDFWQKDESPGFEKTDMAIEKSVRVAMNLVDTAPVDSILDLGKFLWKERMTAK